MKIGRGDSLLIATHNAGKLEEMRAMLGPLGITCVSAADMGVSEPEETEDSFLGNALLKARHAVAATGLPALADDSGLEIDALGGAPGVYTADWATTPMGRDFLMAMERAHRELVLAGAPEPWRARFRATLVLAQPDGCYHVFEGASEGRLVWPLRGALGHGFDPMFQPDGEHLTYAEMAPERKNALSHRAVAVRKLADFLT